MQGLVWSGRVLTNIFDPFFVEHSEVVIFPVTLLWSGQLAVNDILDLRMNNGPSGDEPLTVTLELNPIIGACSNMVIKRIQ
jgi:hypothetical protein